MKWKTYVLFVESTVLDEIKQPIISHGKVTDIECVISHKLYTTVSGEMIYRKVAPSALTRYKGFSLDKNYILEGEGRKYKVTSINKEGRFTQLLLEEIYLEN